MRVLIVGGYSGTPLPSMNRHARHLAKLAGDQGFRVSESFPQASSFALRQRSSTGRKWAGYVDQFILYGSQLRRDAKEADVVHLADQGNALYLRWLDCRRTVVTCHDLLAIRSMLGELDYWSTGKSGKALQKLILASLRKAVWVPCVSPATAGDARRILGTPEDRSPIIPNSCFARLKPGVAEQTSRYIYHIGGNQPYKNREGAVALAEALLSLHGWEGHRFKMLGAAPSPRLLERIAGSRIRERIDVCLSPSDSEAEALASRADLLVFPSRDEGFGLPILEAQSAQVPVATTDKDPMKWTAGEGGIFIDPADPRAGAGLILESLKERVNLIEKGCHNLLRFTEAQEGASLASLYRQAGS
jgi:glycosyltransferase involved in cell wall biosynthesis